MIEPLKHILLKKRIILASASPRRHQILQNIGFPFEVIISNFEENLDKRNFTHPYEYAKETAKGKALIVAQKLAKEKNPADLVIGVDTVVTLDGQIFEKPGDRQEAFEWLSRYSGKTHTVFSGVALVTPKEKDLDSSIAQDFDIVQFHEGTDVTMATLTPNIINAYLDTGEAMGKAGGYGIQGIGGTLVEKVNGDYSNVMGFPLNHFCKQINIMYSK